MKYEYKGALFIKKGRKIKKNGISQSQSNNRQHDLFLYFFKGKLKEETQGFNEEIIRQNQETKSKLAVHKKSQRSIKKKYQRDKKAHQKQQEN